MNILLTGGAGYVGSHVLRKLLAAGHSAVIFDNLTNGHAEAVRGTEIIRGDVLDPAALDALFRAHRFDAVIHFSGLIEAGESVVRPDLYYRVNVVGGLNLLDAMVRAEVKRIVFSSTAAVYGSPETLPITESNATRPLNPYGWSKLMFERVLEDYRAAFGVGYVALRYFNAAGADESGEIGEAHRRETHLIPLALSAARDGRPFTLYGDDYDTRDGTALRDFVHVSDLARAHVDALKALVPGGRKIYNVGSGSGYTCREVVDAAKRLAGRDFPVTIGPRRPGDTPALVASSALLTREIGWTPRYTALDDIMRSAWTWHSTHPQGFSL